MTVQPGDSFRNRRTRRLYTVRLIHEPDERLAGYGMEPTAWCRIDRGPNRPAMHRWSLVRRLEDPARFTRES